MAQSARAAFLGRSVTKTSEDFKKLPGFDGLIEDAQKGRKGDRTHQHQRIGSHFSSSVILEADYDGKALRKTVGFTEDRKNRLSLNQREMNDSRRAELATSALIGVEDVESRQSIFDRASNVDLHQSIAFNEDSSTQNKQNKEVAQHHL